MKYIKSILLSSFLLGWVFSNLGYANNVFKVWEIFWESDKEIITYKVQDIDKLKYNPQGILDIIFAENKRDTELFKKIEATRNDDEIRKIIYSGAKICFPKILIIKNKVAYINFEGDPDYITTRSGTTGAYYFAATVVFNLTEFDNIDSVYFIDEGDHFSTGKSERIDYWELMIQSEKMKYKKIIEERLNAKREDIAKYVYFLQDIGDKESIDKLKALKRQMYDVGYSGCSMDEKQFEELIDKTISIIGNKK